MATKKATARHVIVRTYSAGVHYGTLVDQRGKEVDLSSARRIWSWKGANTLHEVSLHGVAKGSRVSEAVERITLTEAIEVIDCTDEAIANLDSASWEK
jgi:hypothetical protein